jgi:hypothetical protein
MVCVVATYVVLVEIKLNPICLVGGVYPVIIAILVSTVVF